MLSEDEGKTWPHRLLLDDRALVTYPDGTEAANGFIYLIYDRGRYVKDEQEILFAKITETDIRAGKLIHPESRHGPYGQVPVFLTQFFFLAMVIQNLLLFGKH